MTVAIARVTLVIASAQSLKDKRSVVKRLKDLVRQKFNVSVAEIDGHDLWQRSVVAAVTVAADRAFGERILQAVEQEAAALLGPQLAGATVEWLA